VSGPFRVGIELQHAGLPSVARDGDGTVAAGRNFVRDGAAGWVEASSLGVLGDWVLRAVIGPDPLPVLANDGWRSGEAAVFGTSFVAGEIAAVRLSPTGPCPCPVAGAQLLFGGAPSTETVTLRVWDDDVGSLDPGTELFSGEFVLTGADDALQEIDLGGAGLVLDGPVRVGVEVSHSGLPALARDDDGVTVKRNFVDPIGSGWAEASAAGIPGDWVLRLVLAPEPATAPCALAVLGALALLGRRSGARG
jgi:hypothetical protein